MAWGPEIRLRSPGTFSKLFPRLTQEYLMSNSSNSPVGFRPPERFPSIGSALVRAAQLVDAIAERESVNADLKAAIVVTTCEIDALKSQLAELASALDQDVLQGTLNEAVIESKRRVTFPTKTGDPERFAPLNNSLRHSPFWDDCSSVNWNALKRLWISSGSPDELRNILEDYVNEDWVTKVRLRNNRAGQTARGRVSRTALPAHQRRNVPLITSEQPEMEG